MEDKIIERLIDLCESHIKEANDGYKEVRTEYWFGRLCEAEDIKKDLERLIK